jgi:pantoate--beta-alanine ligase
MGFLHEGHLSLIRAARAASDTVLVSLFVNPLQFDRPDDLDSYPRDEERDASLAAAAGADVLFAPTVDEVYPVAPLTRVTVDGVPDAMEGAHRPGHFEGVATVVAKLLAGTIPDLAWFGRKDAQQFALVRRMAADLSFPTEMRSAPTVRERDGLALSSRNVHLDPVRRPAALSLSAGLMAAADAAEGGETAAAVLRGIVAEHLDAADGVRPDYVELADAAEARPIIRLDRPAFLAAAVFVGELRLIDNVWLWPGGEADRGVRLESQSILYGGSD